MLPAARRAVTTLAFLGFFGVLSVAAAHADLRPLPPQPAEVPWPTATWPAGPLPDGISARIEPSLAAVATRDERLGETRAVVLIHHGRLVAERYATGFGPDTPLISWSMAKSVTQALVGVAVLRGLVDIDKPMGNPRWEPSDPRSTIPWRSWINMVDGQDYHEIGVFDQTRNDAARMLFGAGRLDVAGFSASLPLVHAPGTHWNYNSAGVNLIADALGRVFAPNGSAADRRAKVAAVLHDDLFAPIGMTTAKPQFDSTGTFVGSALVYATARDWARFGLLYLRDGMWGERRILPRGWVDFARSKTTAEDCDIYGAGWWVSPEVGRGKPYTTLAPNGPRDLFRAQGFQGQLVAVVPSKDLVVVRLGHFDDRVGWRALSDWLERIVNSFPDA
jgi:CubicO group peptidase (beta-lactamase class C family)